MKQVFPGVVCASRMASSMEWATSTPSADQSGCRVTTIVRRFGSSPICSWVRLPKMMVFPVVTALKRRKSAGMCQSMSSPDPITPLSATAAMATIRISSP